MNITFLDMKILEGIYTTFSELHFLLRIVSAFFVLYDIAALEEHLLCRDTPLRCAA